MTELAHGYLSIAASTKGALADIEKDLDGLQAKAKEAGEKAGDAIAKGVKSKTENLLGQQQAEMASYAAAAQAAAAKAEKANDAQAAAVRKVAIEEAKLKELRDAANTKASTILAAEDRLAKARQAVTKATLDGTAATLAAKKATDDHRQSEERLAKATKDKALADQRAAAVARDAAAAEKTAALNADIAAKANERARIAEEARAKSLGGKIKALLSGKNAKIDIPNPFYKLPDQAEKAGKQAGDKLNDGVKSKATGLSDTIKGVFTGGALLGAAQAAGRVMVTGITESIKGASDLSETLSKSRQIFGQNAAAMDAWAKTAPRALGLTRAAALETATSFGNMFSQLGFSGQKATDMSQSVVQLAADLGSFNNLGTDEVADMLAAAFRGEYDSLQRLIPNINAARVEQEALAMTGKKAAKELTAQEKAAATLAIVTKDGAKAQGDFARTQDGMANKSKIVAAQIETLKQGIGEKLLPVVEKALGWISDKGIPALEKFGLGFQGVLDVLFKGDFSSAFATAFGVAEDAPIVDFLLRVREGFLGIKSILVDGDFKGSMASALNIEEDSPFVALLFNIRDGALGVSNAFRSDAIPALMEFGGWVQTTLVPSVSGVVTAITTWLAEATRIVNEFVAGMRVRIEPMMPMVREVFGVIREIITSVMDLVQTQITNTTMVVGYIWDRWGGDIMDVVTVVFGRVVATVTPALEFIRDLIRTITSVMKGDWGAAWENIKKVGDDALRLLVENIRNLPMGQAFLDILSNAKTSVTNGLKGIQDVWRKVIDVMGGPVKVVEGIINGLLDAWNKIDSIFGGKNQSVKVNISWPTSNPVNLATGGVMPGYTPGRDVHRFVSPTGGELNLSGGEGVLRPEVVRAFGKGWLDRLNLAARTGGVRGVLSQSFATGGVMNFRGHSFTEEFIRRILMAEKIAGATMQITQGGFRPATSYSGTSHAGDALDITGAYQRFIAPLRMVGIPTWDRAGKGNWVAHAHGVPLPGAGMAGGSAVWQAQDYLRGGDGLGGRDDGPRVSIGGIDILGTAVKIADGFTDWTSSFTPWITKAKEIATDSPWTSMLAQIPVTIGEAMKEGAGSLIGFAQGTTNAPRGWAMVGEQGPELVNFAGGEVVLPHETSMGLAGTGGQVAILRIGERDFDAFMEWRGQRSSSNIRRG